jgi:hypothetical protein
VREEGRRRKKEEAVKEKKEEDQQAARRSKGQQGAARRSKAQQGAARGSKAQGAARCSKLVVASCKLLAGLLVTGFPAHGLLVAHRVFLGGRLHGIPACLCLRPASSSFCVF